MRAYDIRLNDNNELIMDLYKVNIARNNNVSYYVFNIDDSFIVTEESLKDQIYILKAYDYFSLSSLIPSNFELEEGSIAYFFSSLALASKHKLLEKVYEEVIVDGVCYIYIYITYVNVNTGEICTKRVNRLGVYSDELEKQLENKGFKHIGDSFLDSYNKNILRREK